jgi:hypothetical protein
MNPMGLTIHYTLASEAERPQDARALIEKLRNRARDLPFAEVGEIVELQGKPADLNNANLDDPLRWLKVQACQILMYKVKGDEYWARVPPTHLIGFTIQPGDGCEPANFGLCRYPKSVIDNGKRVRTKLAGWRWRSFCKTQYASNPDCGGLPNFLRCHVGLVKLLDYAAEICVLAEVKDESGYWERRDAMELVKEIDRWNQMIAGFFGAMKDTLEKMGEPTRTLEAEITKFPNFEHLEAKGRADEK